MPLRVLVLVHCARYCAHSMSPFHETVRYTYRLLYRWFGSATGLKFGANDGPDDLVLHVPAKHLPIAITGLFVGNNFPSWIFLPVSIAICRHP